MNRTVRISIVAALAGAVAVVLVTEQGGSTTATAPAGGPASGPSSATATAPATGPAAEVALVHEAYPDLARSGLTCARLSALPEGILLQAGDLTITQEDLDKEIAQAPEPIRGQLRKNGFFVLEHMATGKLLLRLAKDDAAKAKIDISEATDREIIRGYFDRLTSSVEVTEQEIADFFADNPAIFGNTPLAEVKPKIQQYLLAQKRQKTVAEHVLGLGKITPLAVSAPWVEVQAALAKDNPIDKARASGKPTFVEFYSDSCPPCRMMKPIVAAIEKKYKGKLNVVRIDVAKEQFLANRHGIESIPVQAFFDKDGKQAFRHVGFFGRDAIEKKLAEIGVE